MENQGTVTAEVRGHIATIAFGHPASNSLPGKILKKLACTISSFDNDESVRAIILKSEGDKTFCAGASFDELIAIDTEEAGLAFFSGFAHVINAARKSPKIVVGRIQGKAVGGGVGLAAACDYALATQDASVKLSELAVGIGPFVVGPAVEKKIGTERYAQLALDAKQWRTAAWAHQHGLYAEVYPDVQSLDEAVTAMAKQFAQYNPEALTALKRTIWKGTEDWDTLLIERAKISGRLVLSDFTRNAIELFKQKTVK
ncbi:MAG: enoyl-CoA hydratase/isomerase family protein [Edaphocola sp.]